MEMQEMQMLNSSVKLLNSVGNSTDVTGVFNAIGLGIGGAVGGIPGAMVGGAIGSLIGGITNSFIPSYATVQNSNGALNFTVGNRKPFWLEYHCPTKEELMRLDKIYKYYGCATHRTEPLSMSNYMYQGHAYVKGDLHFNDTIPLKYFQQINNIFNRGVHILEK